MSIFWAIGVAACLTIYTLNVFYLKNSSSNAVDLSSARRGGGDADRRTVQEVEFPSILKAPRKAVSTPDFAETVDEAVVRELLERLPPASPKPMPSIVMSTHALRLWGADSQFSETAVVPEGYHFQVWRFSCPTLVRFLLDHNVYKSYYDNAEPFLRSTEHGIGVRFKPGNFMDRPVNHWPDCDAHIDKMISVLAQIGIPSNHPVYAPDRSGSVVDLLRDSMLRFVPEQELEFSCTAYLHYLKLPAIWENRHGDRVELNEMLRRLVAKELGDGACVGTHVQHVVSLALHVDRDDRFLDTTTRRELEDHLRLASRRLELSQESSGAWPPDWSLTGQHKELVASEGTAAARLRVTGHHLEWIALAPSSLRPADESIRRAIMFIQRTLRELPGDNYYHNYTALTHAVRALVLLSGRNTGDLRPVIVPIGS